LTLAFRDGTLSAQTAYFTTTLRAVLDGKGQPHTYLAIDPPLAGVPLQLTNDSRGRPIVIVGGGLDQYSLARVSMSGK
jgi:hypothetical protein